jgi:thiamine pyrophosphate-dependent acetolactate synthase large subunit-like protein
MTLDRREAVARLLQDRGDALVVSGLGSPSYDVFAAGDHDANFYLWGAMGGAAMVGLGLALAQPERPVLVITGDGEQLMGMGGLATIGAAGPANLTVAVLDNRLYGETGMQASHTGRGANLAAVASGCGIGDCREVADMAGLNALRAAVAAKAGPVFAAIRIAPEEKRRVLPPRDGVHLKNRLRAHLGLATI